MLFCDMVRSANDSFELANRLLHQGGSKIPDKQTGSGKRSRLARRRSEQAQESSEAHSHHLQRLQKSASDAAENLATSRERQRKKAAAKLKRTATKKRIA